MSGPRRRCLLCGGPGERRHHPTGSSGGRYWDPDFTVPLCHSDHALLHDDWYSAGVSDKLQPPTLLHMSEVSLRRVGMLVGRVPATEMSVDLNDPLAVWLATSADRLQPIRAAFDEGVPRWELLPGLRMPHA